MGTESIKIWRREDLGPYIEPESEEVMVVSGDVRRVYRDGGYTGETVCTVWYCSYQQWLTGVYEFTLEAT